jgi:hypothetical protein
MHGRHRSRVLAVTVGATLVASGVVAASASVADESHDDVVAAAPPADDAAREARAARASRAVFVAEARAAAVVEHRRLARAERRHKALVRERRERIRERKQLQRQRRAMAPAADPARAGSVRALGKRMARQHGFDSWWQWNCLDALWTAESGWSTSATNGSTGAYGIPQAYPGSKMASHGSDWRTSARTQISWGLSYIDDRWGTPCGAYSQFKRAHWY